MEGVEGDLEESDDDDDDMERDDDYNAEAFAFRKQRATDRPHLVRLAVC